MKTYKESVKYLYSLQKFGIKFGLSKTSNLLEKLGNPHHGRKYIHIAGSNGKGSVAAMLESILKRSGLKVGFYSSPHLVRFTERFRINGKEIPKKRVVELISRLRDVIDPDHPPTFFEVTTAMALIYFAMEDTDISIMEVGMGGRLDATNVITPLVSAITNISLEHQFYLGKRLLDIAGEKAGIIKEGVDVVTSSAHPSVIRLFEDICAKKRSPLWRVGKDVRYRATEKGLSYYGFKRVLRDLELGLKGRFQRRNAALSLAITELLESKGFNVSDEDIREGVKNAVWPGRMQIVSRNPLIVLDGAHNPRAMRELAGSIEKDFAPKGLILVLGIMADKDILKIIKRIAPLARYVICTSPDYSRSANPEDLMKDVSALGKKGEVIPVISKALARAKEMAGKDDMILVTGSLFTVSEALTYFDPEKYRRDGF